MDDPMTDRRIDPKLRAWASQKLRELIASLLESAKTGGVKPHEPWKKRDPRGKR